MKHPSAKTSVSQIPAAYTEPGLKHVYAHARNLDYGGGRFEVGTAHLAKVNCQNFVYDPHCMTPAHNIHTLVSFGRVGFQVISCLNVLNVLLDKKDRDEAIEAVKLLASENTSVKHVVFQVYTVNSSGAPTKTQLNKKAEYYWPALTEAFGSWSYEIIGDKNNIIHFCRE